VDLLGKSVYASTTILQMIWKVIVKTLIIIYYHNFIIIGNIYNILTIENLVFNYL